MPAQTRDPRLDEQEQQSSLFKFAPPRTQLSQDRLQTQTTLGFELQTQPLEGAVDPQSYIVGAGDVFLINIMSAEEVSFRMPVTAEGKLVIPTIATLDVKRKTLSEVQKMVQEAGSAKYIDSKIAANLILLRKIKVHVTGQVKRPGSYEALAVDRISNAIGKAGGLTSFGSERAIEIRHSDGTKDIIDLYRYSKLGDLGVNMHVRGGDVIYVPHLNFSHSTVQVDGPIKFPGTYQLAENETLEEFLLRVGAYNRSANLGSAYIIRKTSSNGNPEVLPIFPFLEKQHNGRTAFYLQDKDIVMIPRREEKVYVVGAVRNPGAFDYYPDLQAVAYVGLAGSTERATKLSKIRIIRLGADKQLKGMNQVIEPGDTIFVPQKAEFGLREITTVIVTITNVLLTMKAIDVL